MQSEKRKILKEIFGSYKKEGSEILFYCPFCEHHKRKLSVNLKKGAYKCWVCESSGYKLYRLVRTFGSYEHRRKWAELEDGIELNNFQEQFLRIFRGEDIEKPTINLPKDFKTLATNNLSYDAIEAKEYLRSRNVTNSDILKWKIGYCSRGKYKDRIIVPSFNLRGDVDYFVARTFKNEWPTYIAPRVSRDEIVFNELYVDWTKDLTIVEGVFDAIVAGNSIPILGSTIKNGSKIFESIVMHDTPIYLALDADVKKKESRIIESLLEYDIELYKVDTSGYDDISDMGKVEFRIRKRYAEKITRDSYLNFVLNAV